MCWSSDLKMIALATANLNQFYSSYSGYSMNWANNPLTGTGTGVAATWNMDLFNPGLYPSSLTTTDLTRAVPALTATDQGIFQVRGIGTQGFGRSAEQSVSVVLDAVPDKPVLVTMQRSHGPMPEKGARISLRHEVDDVVLISE